ncbi:MAG: 1-acyl-sn-glycerol-3-phosphate acyltransferase [Nitrospirae bacterium]|nr:MAG: 1-acyl-sn-glycerol-3-phosphate acyltransferase [Nitrospirota bacterium]
MMSMKGHSWPCIGIMLYSSHYYYGYIMLMIRRVYKIVLLFGLNLLFLFVGLLIRAVPFAGRSKKTHWAVRGMMFWARASCFVMGIRIQTSGFQRRPTGVFVVSNHSSYTDIPVLGSMIPTVFLSKQEVSSWFLFGRLARLGGTVFVKRESKTSTLTAVREAGERLVEGTNIVIFPEGTTDDGRQLKEFKSSFFAIPLETAALVLPVSIYYSHVDGVSTALSPDNEMAWHDNRDLFGHFWNLLSKKRIDVKLHFSQVVGLRDGSPIKDRKQFALITRQSVQEGLDMLKTRHQ